MKKITRDNIIDITLERFPDISIEVDRDDGAYNIMGAFAQYIGGGIEELPVDNLIIQDSIDFINILAQNDDTEVINLLTVGVFEVLDNYKIFRERILDNLNEEALFLFRKYCCW